MPGKKFSFVVLAVLLIVHAFVPRWTKRVESKANCVELNVGCDSSVGTATRYGLEGPGIESRWRGYLPNPCRLELGPTQFPVQWSPSLFPGGKAAGAWR